MEQAFHSDFVARFASQRRAALVLGALIWESYFWWDFHLASIDPAFVDLSATLATMRFGAFLVIVASAVIAMSNRYVTDAIFADRVTIVGMILTLAINSFMIFIAPHPYDYLYYVFGVVAVVMYSLGMLRFRSRSALLILAIFTPLVVALILIAHPNKVGTNLGLAELMYTKTSIAWIITCELIGYLICVQLERSARNSFAAMQELTAMNIEVRKKADAIISLEAALRSEAEERNRAKSKFIASAVHDLKQPLQAIVTALEPVQHTIKVRDLERAEQLIQLVRRSTEVMRIQLNSILDLSRLESGLFEVNLQPIDLVKITGSVLEQVQSYAVNHGVEISLTAPEDESIFARSDTRLLHRLLTNIVNNSIKYRTVDQNFAPHVRLSIGMIGTHAKISIQDNGIGIEQSLIDSEAIFKPFFQVNNQHPESEKGVGLGLAIVKVILNLMPDHSLKIESVQRQGSRFELSLPIDCAAQTLLDDAKLNAMSLENFDLSALYLLIVEDDELVLRSTEALLDMFGALHQSAVSLEDLGKVILSMEREPDVLITDFRLPDGKTAVDVIQFVQSRFGSVSTIVFTGESLAAEIPEELAKFPLLKKPIAPLELVRCIEEVSR